MKLLILGGGGRLSGCVARTALARGDEVWTVTRSGRGLPDGAHRILADRNQAEAFAAALAAAGIVFDAALDCICMNAAHARQDLDVLANFTHRAVIVSTDSVYDPQKKRVPQDENGDGYVMDDTYAGNKRKMELEFLHDTAGKLEWTLLRPGHIYGPGFELGCFPEHFRQPDLLAHIRADRPLRLVSGGHLHTQPTYVQDLADTMFDCIANEKTFCQIFCIGGPQAIENRYYYETIGRIVGHPVTIEEIPLAGYIKEHPQYSDSVCERSYTLEKLRSTGVRLPATPIEEGLRRHIEWLDARAASRG